MATTQKNQKHLDPADQALLERFAKARKDLDEGLIRPELTSAEPERTLRKWNARKAEMRSFLAECGDPQLAYPAIHVTGTSGKGSVATYIADALRRSGLKVGLHVSPFLQTPTEKIWIDGELLHASDFADLVEWVWPVAIPRKRPETPASIHGMASVAIALEAYRRAEVDIVVMEAGCGGRFDLTNVMRTAAAVVTNVGMDHAMSLGPTVKDIAWHKAGILKADAAAVTGAAGDALEVIRAEARELDVTLQEVACESERFWEVNGALARAALDAVSDRFPVTDQELSGALESACQPGRRELVPEGDRRVILDGAHNPDKMAALVRTVEPGSVFVVGCLQAKNLDGLVDAIAPAAAAVVATEPTVYAKPPAAAADLAAACAERGVESHAEPDPLAAVDRALQIARPDQQVVITGSLYLIGEIRERWYPTDQVVLQQSSWPS